MDDVGGERGRKGDASPSSSSPFRALTPRGPGLLPSPSGSSLLPSPPPAAAAAVLALPAASRVPVARLGAGLLASPCLAGAMDGGGEALLVRRSKGKKRPLPVAPTERESAAAAGGGDRSRALWRDYHDLLEEIEAKKKRLASANRRKLGLLAEVKFLRRKYKSFAKGDSQQTHYKLKGQARQIPSPAGSNEASAFADHGAGAEVPSISRNPNLDLNQDNVMNDKRNDYQGHQGHTESLIRLGWMKI